jgi:hypothetical protein
MRTITRFGGLVPSIAVVVVGWRLGVAGADAAIKIRPQVEVSDASREQVELVRWAIGRFEVAGLTAPSVRIAFRDDADDCGEHLGFARGDRVDVCAALVNAMTRRILLHEVGHVWLDQNTGPSTRRGFLELRGLPSWNSPGDPWELRGFEQGAEIISWALGERILTAQIPDNRPDALGRAFAFLTGRALPTT